MRRCPAAFQFEIAISALTPRRTDAGLRPENLVNPLNDFHNGVIGPPEGQQVISSQECPIRAQRFRRAHRGIRQLLIEGTQLSHLIGPKGESAFQNRPRLRSKRFGHRDIPFRFQSSISQLAGGHDQAAKTNTRRRELGSISPCGEKVARANAATDEGFGSAVTGEEMSWSFSAETAPHPDRIWRCDPASPTSGEARPSMRRGLRFHWAEEAT